MGIREEGGRYQFRGHGQTPEVDRLEESEERNDRPLQVSHCLQQVDPGSTTSESHVF